MLCKAAFRVGVRFAVFVTVLTTVRLRQYRNTVKHIPLIAGLPAPTIPHGN